MQTTKVIETHGPVHSLAQALNSASLVALAQGLVTALEAEIKQGDDQQATALAQYETQTNAAIQALQLAVSNIEVANGLVGNGGLNQVASILESFLNSPAIGGLLGTLHINVQGTDYTLESVVKAVAGANSIKAERFAKNADGSYVASMDFTDGSTSDFVAQLGTPDASGVIPVVFAAPNFAGTGVPASFPATFKDFGSTVSLANGTQLQVTSYVVTERGNIVIDLVPSLTVYVPPVDPVPAAMTGAQIVPPVM